VKRTASKCFQRHKWFRDSSLFVSMTLSGEKMLSFHFFLKATQNALFFVQYFWSKFPRLVHFEVLVLNLWKSWNIHVQQHLHFICMSAVHIIFIRARSVYTTQFCEKVKVILNWTHWNSRNQSMQPCSHITPSILWGRKVFLPKT